MEKYNAQVTYPCANGTIGSIRQSGFTSVASATEWVSEKLTWFMMNWATIDPNGITITAEVFNSSHTFSDMYQLECEL